jgi:hypothetical protein
MSLRAESAPRASSTAATTGLARVRRASLIALVLVVAEYVIGMYVNLYAAAATPRPSAIPPAASTGVGATRSATMGTNGSVDLPRLAPCPPASVPCATMKSAPASTASLASSRSVT